MTPPRPTARKRSWPLVTLATCSFIPLLGFMLGAAAVTWGLLSDRPRARLAIAIGGAGAFSQLIGTALLIWVFRDNPVMQEAQTVSTSADLAQVVIALDTYHTRAGRYPVSLQDLLGRPIPIHMVNINDYSAGLFRSRPYEYHPTPDHQHYKLFAVGPDGVPGTSDDIYPADTNTTATAKDSALEE